MEPIRSRTAIGSRPLCFCCDAQPARDGGVLRGAVVPRGWRGVVPQVGPQGARLRGLVLGWCLPAAWACLRSACCLRLLTSVLWAAWGSVRWMAWSAPFAVLGLLPSRGAHAATRSVSSQLLAPPPHEMSRVLSYRWQFVTSSSHTPSCQRRYTSAVRSFIFCQSCSLFTTSPCMTKPAMSLARCCRRHAQGGHRLLAELAL